MGLIIEQQRMQETRILNTIYPGVIYHKVLTIKVRQYPFIPVVMYAVHMYTSIVLPRSQTKSRLSTLKSVGKGRLEMGDFQSFYTGLYIYKLCVQNAQGTYRSQSTNIYHSTCLFECLSIIVQPLEVYCIVII